MSEENASATIAALRAAARAEKRRAEAAEAQLRQLREAVDAMPEGMALFDAQDRYVFWNGAYARIYAAAGDELKIGGSFRAVVEALTRARSYRLAPEAEQAWIAERLRRHAERSDNFEQRMADGSTVRVAERALSGGGAVGVHIDISELIERERSLTALLENNPIPAYLADRESLRFLQVNQAAVDFYGYSREQFLAMTMLDIRPPEERPRVLEVVRTLDAKIMSGGEFVHLKANGERVDVAIHSRRIDYRGADCLVVAVVDLSERRAREKQIAHITHHDALTGLHNRRAFAERLEACVARAEAGGEAFALIAIDLDRFKETNELFGAEIGDALLQQAAARFAAAAAPAFVARVASDEFVVLLEQRADRGRCAVLGEKLRREAARAYDLDELRLELGASLGVAIFPGDGPARELYAQASAALAQAKAEGRNMLVFYDGALGAAARARQQLLHDLKQAVAREQFEVWLQPQADLSGAVIGYEALLRWRHPTRGLVPPDQFIPLAEENGLIVEIDRWTLRQCCREAALWRNDLHVAVNISALHFGEDDFVDTVRAVLRETGMPPHRLELEVTESVLVEDSDAASAILRKLKGLGVTLALDDFGAGYSSLAYLQNLPFDRLKIDRSFIFSLKRVGKSRAIVRAIVELGRGLGLQVIAEGVETRAQLAILRETGCTQFQGYLLGRPAPLEEQAVLARRPGTAA